MVRQRKQARACAAAEYDRKDVVIRGHGLPHPMSCASLFAPSIDAKRRAFKTHARLHQPQSDFLCPTAPVL